MYRLIINDNRGQQLNSLTFDAGSFIIGRMEETSDIVLPSPSVSRNHARLFVSGGRCYIEDLGSANGVVVDGQKVLDRRDLGTSSHIIIGNFNLVLQVENSSGRRTANRKSHSTLFTPKDSDHFKLVRIRDLFAGEEFVLSEVENTIGRTDENFILLADPSISRRHAKIVRDGDRYMLVDLGSSNGTRVNGRRVKNIRQLEERDRVKFGNLEFVFVSSDIKVDHQRYARASSSKALVLPVILTVIVVLVAVGAGGWILLQFLSKEDPSKSNAIDIAAFPTEDNESSVTDLFKKAQNTGFQGSTNLDAEAQEALSAMEERNWSEAIEAFEILLEKNPDQTQYRRLRKQALWEQRAQQHLDKGEKLVESGQYLEARDVLLEIPEGSAVYERALIALDNVNKTLAHQLRNEAQRLMRSNVDRDLQEAHQLLSDAYDLDNASLELKSSIKDLERTLEQRGLFFRPVDLDSP